MLASNVPVPPPMSQTRPSDGQSYFVATSSCCTRETDSIASSNSSPAERSTSVSCSQKSRPNAVCAALSPVRTALSSSFQMRTCHWEP